MPRIRLEPPSPRLGFMGDFFGELLYTFRADTRYVDFVKTRLHLCGADMRDPKAITRFATDYMKLLFPDLIALDGVFYKECGRPTIEMRQRVRDDLHKRDAQYPPTVICTIG